MASGAWRLIVRSRWWLGVAIALVISMAHASEPPNLDCGACHVQIFQEWQTSWMARANSNPNFQTHFQRWQRQVAKNPAVAGNPQFSPDQCLRCHAPQIDTGGGAKRQGGVTCLTCHGVRKAREEQHGHALFYDSRGVIYGPGHGTNAPHPVKQGDHFADSSLCAGCHRDITPNGVALERTFEEWRASRYADQGVQCAGCHMPQVEGAPSTDSPRSQHASHRFWGGHADSPLLKGAARLELKQKAGQVLVSVVNQTVGHHFPTGGAHPNKLVLNIELLDVAGKVVAIQTRTYRYDYLSPAGGLRLPTDLIDSTLRPGEKREETIAVQPPTVRLRAWLEYQIVPDKLLKLLPAAAYAPVRIDETSLALGGAGG